MRRRTVRRRLYLVLLQALALLGIATTIVLTLAFSGARHSVVEDRLLFARTIAHSLDATVSSAIQDLGRLAADLPEDSAGMAARLRLFRFHSPFREATYVLDQQAKAVISDPEGVRPLDAQWLASHERITPLIRKSADDPRPVLALVQPFRREQRSYFLVSEMNPRGSIVSAFLQDLGPEPGLRVAVVDDNGVVIASPDQALLYRGLSCADAYGARIRAHRPLVQETSECPLSPSEAATETLTVMVPLRFAPWGVVVQASRATAYAALYATRRGLIVAGLLLAVTGLVLARALSRSLVTPIQQLSRQAEALRAGDLSSAITVSGDHEVEMLAQTLDGARQRLSSTLRELTALNEDLESQVASRTRVIEARYQDLRFLHAVSQLATQEREPERVVPDILNLIAEHYAFPAAAIVSRPPGRPPVTYVVPPGASIPGLGEAETLPPAWQRRAITYQGQLEAELVHPRREDLDEQVVEALTHQLAVSLHGAHLWQRTIEQDEQRRVLVRRLLGATEEERRRIARELHDETAQLLTVIQLSLERVQVDTPEMRRAKDLLGETQREIHRIIYDLRPSLLDDLGLAAAIKSYAQEHLEGNGLTVSVEIEKELPARPEIDIPMFRIYQELVTNILRHAQAEHVSIELDERGGMLILAVEDDGMGFDPGEKSEGAGITGMRERAALVNGSIRFDAEPGMGTHVVVEIPIR